MSDEAILSAHGYGGATHVATGGAARVYRHHALALKVVDEALAPTLVAEARLLSLIGAPLVPRVHAAHHRLLALEWLDGVTVQHWLSTEHSGEDRLRIATQLAHTLGEIHARGVVHRDVKSSNVMLTKDGPRWFDLGLALPNDQDGAVLAREGTRTTMAPEAWKGTAANTRTDVYSLGVLLFEVLTGRAPFTGDAAALEFAHRHERAPNAGLGAHLDAVLSRCLEKDPAARFSDAREVAAALRDGEATLQSVPPHTAHAQTARASREAEGATLIGSVERLTALLALPATSAIKELSTRFGAIGAVWVGGTCFAHPHPLGPAHGLAQLDALAKTVASQFTLHVAPLRVRVRSLSVRISGEAIDRLDWVSAAPGRTLTPAAAEHFTATQTAAPLQSQTEWLEDGTRLPPIEAALERSPSLIWVKAPSGSGRTRLLDELARRIASRSPSDGEVLLVDDAERLSWQQWEWVETLTAPGHATPTDVVLIGDERIAALRPHLGSRAANFRVVTPSLLSDEEARRLVRSQLAPAELLPEVLVRELAEAGSGLAGTITESIQILKQRGLLARDVQTGEWRLSSDVRGLRAGAKFALDALNELPSALHDLARLLALAHWRPSVLELDEALRALPEAFNARRLDAAAGVAQLTANGFGALSAGRFVWERQGLQRSLAAETGPRVSELHRALATSATSGLRRAEAQLAAEFARARETTRAPQRLPTGEFARVRARLAAAAAGLAAPAPAVRTSTPEPIDHSARAIRVAAWVEALAHHAHAAGWVDVAASASADAGLAALQAGDAIGCDLFLTRSLAHQQSGALLLARARARRQLERFADAIADARAVTGELELRVAARLEASLSLDWMNEFSQANDESERALTEGAPFEDSPTPLGRELRLARGRLHVRAGRWNEAIEVLAPLCEHPPAPEEVETILGAHALAASVCCVLNELPRGERLFAAGLELAERHGQPVVGCALLINRPMLWMGLGKVEAALADLRAAATISRRLGHAQIERVASHNLAQYLLWLGRLDEADALAARAEQLATLRLGGDAPPADQLLLARLEVSRANRNAAQAHLDRIVGRQLNPSETLQRDVVRAWLGQLAWTEVLDEREGVVPDELLDAALLAQRFATDDAVRAKAAERSAALRPAASVTHPA
ncbi:MAG: serine/threonine-protein kinase [Archangium sp.]